MKRFHVFENPGGKKVGARKSARAPSAKQLAARAKFAAMARAKAKARKNPLTRAEVALLNRDARYLQSRARDESLDRYNRSHYAGMVGGIRQAIDTVGVTGVAKHTRHRSERPLHRASRRLFHETVGAFNRNSPTSRGRSATNNPRRKQMASAKQIAWRRKFAAMSRAGTLRKGRKYRDNPRGRPLSGKSGTYRPRLPRRTKSVGRAASRHFARARKIHMAQIRRGHPIRKKSWAKNPGMSYNRTRRSHKARSHAAKRYHRASMRSRRGHRLGHWNPGILQSIKSASPFSMSKGKQIAAGLGGAIAVVTIPRFLPSMVTSMFGSYGPLVGQLLALTAGGFLASKFAPNLATAVMTGGGTIVAWNLAAHFVPSVLSIGAPAGVPAAGQIAGFLPLPQGARLAGFLPTPQGSRLAGMSRLGALQVPAARMGAIQVPAAAARKMAGFKRIGSKSF